MISGMVQVTPSDVVATSTTKNGVLLGTKGVTRDGKIYRWTQNGSTALASGITVASQARVANHTNLAVAAASIGATKVTVTLGGTAVTQDQYADGYAFINDGPGIGQSLLVVGHQAQSSGSGTVDLLLAQPLTVALTASSKVTLLANQNAGVVVTPAAVTNTVVGATSLPVAGSAYFWAQTRGMASVLSDGIITKNAGAIVSDAVAGSLEIEVAATVTQRVAFAPDATVDTKYYPLFLVVD